MIDIAWWQVATLALGVGALLLALRSLWFPY